MNNSIRKSIAITLLLAAAMSLTASGIWTYTLYQSAFKNNSDAIESYQTIRAINRTLISINEAELDISSFIMTRDNHFINKLPELIVSIQVNLATLTQLIQDNATEIAMNNKLTTLTNTKIAFFNSILQLHKSSHKNATLSPTSISNRLKLTYNINQLMNGIRKIEISQLEEAMPEYQLSINTANRSFVLLGTLNILLILIAYFCTRPLLNCTTRY